MSAHELRQVADAMVRRGKGIIAIDESINTCNKRFEQVGIPPESAQRRAYRELLLTTPRLSESISGAILYDEKFDKATVPDASSWTSSTNGASFLVLRWTSVPYRCRAAPVKR